MAVLLPPKVMMRSSPTRTIGGIIARTTKDCHWPTVTLKRERMKCIDETEAGEHIDSRRLESAGVASLFAHHIGDAHPLREVAEAVSQEREIALSETEGGSGDGA